jgi:Uncharacterized conserved protein
MQNCVENIKDVFKDLASHNRWGCYKKIFDKESGKYSKIPISAITFKGAKSNDPKTWCSLGKAISYLNVRKDLSGIVLALTSYDDIVGIDIDHCIDENGELSAMAKEIIDLADSYTEISPSGAGIRIILHGELPKDLRKNTANCVEVYDSHRFLTITGNHLTGTPMSINIRHVQVKEIHQRFIKKEIAFDTVNSFRTIEDKHRSMVLEDDELLDLAASAANGDTFEDLLAGNWECSYNSQSEADAAFCCNLAWWSGWNAEQMDRIFRDSGLYRDKWDSIRYGDGRTYGQGLIEWAITVTNSCYLQEDNEDYEH